MQNKLSMKTSQHRDMENQRKNGEQQFFLDFLCEAPALLLSVSVLRGFSIHPQYVF
jgi:hypothetical protein